MNRNNIAIGMVAAGVLLAGIAGWFWYKQRQADQVPEAVAETLPPDDAVPLPEDPNAIQHPIEVPEAAPEDEASLLPAIGETDVPLSTDLSQLAGEGTVMAWLVPDGIVRRFVATVDNLPRSHVAERSRVLRGASGQFAVERTTVDATTGEERIVAAPSNTSRYDGAVAALQALDMARVAAVYRRWYPRFQEAYEDLGYPGRYFNDRVIAVIDHLLETRVPAESPELVQPKVLFQYADAALESRSAGQKLLMRMGPEHAAVVKGQLAALRAELANDNQNQE